jgi:hypothetical protein
VDRIAASIAAVVWIPYLLGGGVERQTAGPSSDARFADPADIREAQARGKVGRELALLRAQSRRGEGKRPYVRALDLARFQCHDDRTVQQFEIRDDALRVPSVDGRCARPEYANGVEEGASAHALSLFCSNRF